MSLVRAGSLGEAVEAMAALPEALLLSGGTEVLVGLHERRIAPRHLVSLRRVPGLRGVLSASSEELLLGALTTYTELGTATATATATGAVPGSGRIGENPSVLTAMAPTVGSPASRNAGTLGGALGTGSGAGDACTALLALDAQLLVSSVSGSRRVPIARWLDRGDRRHGDVVTAVAVAPTTGGQHYLKPGERQAVSYATVSCALVVDAASRRVRLALGSVGPLPWRALEAEGWLAQELGWDGNVPVADAALCARFAEQIRAELPEPTAGPRVSAAHRRHIAGVLASRALSRAAGVSAQRSQAAA